MNENKTKTCRGCGLNSDDLSLFKRRKDGKYGRDSWCLKCHSAYYREWTARNPKRQSESKKSLEKAVNRNQEIILEIKTTTPCADCNQIFPPAAMDFDHVRGEKKASISAMRWASEERLREEISKCEIVCANCHRLRTQKRGWSGHRNKRVWQA